MHDQAWAWFQKHACVQDLVLDIGGRTVDWPGLNHPPHIRTLFPDAEYVVLDLYPGDGVDIVADAATWVPDRAYALVLAAEVFEHAPKWPKICLTAFAALRPGGRFITTMAGPGRPEHSGIDGGPQLHPGEYYANVDPLELQLTLESCGFVDIVVDQQHSPADVRAVATKPRGGSHVGLASVQLQRPGTGVKPMVLT